MSWNGHKGISYEVDPRHAELVEHLGLQDVKDAAILGICDEGRTKEKHAEALNETEASYRAAIARCNYLAADRPNIAYAVKELARTMANPTHGDTQRLKRLGRHPKRKPRLQ